MGDEMGMIDEAKKRRDMSLAALGRAIFPGVSMQSMADEKRENEDKNIIGSLIKAFAACERELALAELREEQSAELDRLRARNRDLETAFVAPLRALASGRCYWLKQADTFPDRGHAACSENLEKSRGEWCEVCYARDKLAALARRKGGI